MVALLSQCKEMASIGCCYNFMSNNIFLSHFANLPVVANAINFDSNVECEIHVCFFDAQEIVPPPRVNT
jgi:hypothetical protein